MLLRTVHLGKAGGAAVDVLAVPCQVAVATCGALPHHNSMLTAMRVTGWPLPCSAAPIFFILFPGYSPSKEIEQYARKLGKTVEGGNLTLISMGQGQEGPAEAVLDK